MKVLYVVTGLNGGGAEKVVVGLADQMVTLGHEVKIAYLKGKDIVVKPQSKKVEIIYLGFENAVNLFSASIQLQKLIKKFNPDIVHSHMVHANIFTRLTRIFQYMPKLICTAHNSNEGGKLRMFGYKITDKLSDINTNVSYEATEKFILKRAFKSNAITVYNGIDLNKFKFIKNNNIHEVPELIAIGRLTAQKDYPNLLSALKLVKKSGVKFKMSIIGDGEEKNHILDLIRLYDLNDSVSLLGRRENIPELLNQSDIFVLSSQFEGFGLVVAEAMACNIFVIGTDSGGVKEVMGGYGILVPPQNSQALSLAIIEAINMTNEEIAINNIKAYEHIKKNFDLDKITKHWLKLYEM